jgi:hypothetical protein
MNLDLAGSVVDLAQIVWCENEVDRAQVLL